MNAERLLAHYERIADAPDAIGRLRRFILDLAVRGKLVLQDLNDEPTSILLKRIAVEQAQGRKRESDFSRAVNTEELADLPRNWSLVPLIAVRAFRRTSRASPKGHTSS
jgi:type I restriction enzyme, S subunit